MADLRHIILSSYLLTLLSCLLLLAQSITVCALPTTKESIAGHHVDLAAHNWKRFTPIVVTSADGSNVTVLNPDTRQGIPQGIATDGAGVSFSPPAIIWLVFAFVVGVPLALAGIRLWRFTTGMGVGLAVTVCCGFLSIRAGVLFADAPLLVSIWQCGQRS